MQCSRSLISSGIKRCTGASKTCLRGFARDRRGPPRRPTEEMLAGYARAAAEPNPHDGYVEQADKIMSGVRDKVKMNKVSNSTHIKEGEVEENNAWNWVPPRDGEREDDEIIPVIKG